MMGSKGLTDASKIAILNANYMAKRLEVPFLSSTLVFLIIRSYLVAIVTRNLTRYASRIDRMISLSSSVESTEHAPTSSS